MGLERGTFTGDLWLPVPTVLANLTSSRAESSLSVPTTTTPSANQALFIKFIAICVNRSGWHFESNRLV